MPAAPAISVVIVAYKSGPTLARCLAALKAQTHGDFETLLVDNGGDDAPAKAAKADKSIRLISPGENLGFAAANNLAARQAAGRWLVLLNPDAYADPDWLEKLVGAAARWPNHRAFTSRQLMDEDPQRLDGLGEVFSPCGAAMMIDRALFLILGGFDESFFCYCEDVDLGFRLQLAREKVLVVPSAVVRHEGSASSGGPASDFAVFHGTRNRLWMLVKDLPWPLLIPVLSAHFAAVGAQLFLARRNPAAARTLKALVEAVKTLETPWRAREAVQAARKASWLEIARAMTWKPYDLLRMRPDIRTPTGPR